MQPLYMGVRKGADDSRGKNIRQMMIQQEGKSKRNNWNTFRCMAANRKGPKAKQPKGQPRDFGWIITALIHRDEDENTCKVPMLGMQNLPNLCVH